MHLSRERARMELWSAFRWTRMTIGNFLRITIAAVLCAALPSMMPACAAESGPNGNTSVPSAIDDFGFRLLATLSDGAHENVIVSPLSVSVALAMTYNGAAGDTKTGMAAALGLSSLDDDAINRGNHELVAALAKADPAVQIAIANALWAQAGFTIEKSFLDLNRNFYGAKVESLDFASNPAAAADVINRWVNQNTKGKIPTIIGVPESNTRLTLTNAVYFKGKWASPFDPKKTQPRTFHLAGGASAQAPTMVQEGKYPYFETTSLQAIRLAYGNGRYEMYVFLPRDGEGLSAFVKSLNQTRWNEWRGQFFNGKARSNCPASSPDGASTNPALKAIGDGDGVRPQSRRLLAHPYPSADIVHQRRRAQDLRQGRRGRHRSRRRNQRHDVCDLGDDARTSALRDDR